MVVKTFSHGQKRPCKKDTIEALEQKVDALSKMNGAIKIDTTPQKHSNTMDYTKKTCEELIAICKEKSIKGYSGKKKEDIVKLLTDAPVNEVLAKNEVVGVVVVYRNAFFVLINQGSKCATASTSSTRMRMRPRLSRTTNCLTKMC